MRGGAPTRSRSPQRATEAERAGFEPATHLSARTRFPVALLRPLGHLSEPAQRTVTPQRYVAAVDVTYEWRGAFENAEVNELHAEAFQHPVLADDWLGQLSAHSLGWVCARGNSRLVGFVNVAWDGCVHAFVLDTIVAATAGRRGIGTALVAAAVEGAKAGG